MNWELDSWREKNIKQQPTYEDTKLLKEVEDKLKIFPPLVFAGEVRDLKSRLASVAKGESFLLQCGDCAESFAEFNANNIKSTFKIILQMAVVLMYSSSKPVVKIGRIAGQFAKPRSSDFETQGDMTLPSYRGDIVNGIEFTKEARMPDPNRLLQAYNQSTSTQNLLRAFARGGFADLNDIHRWNEGFLSDSKLEARYKEISERIYDGLKFMEACGIGGHSSKVVAETSFFTSHEALLLGYEQALTREDSISGDYYDCSAHMLWIGDRTRGIDDAHVEFLRGVKNPIGIKIGPSISGDDIIKLTNKLNPENEYGRITLISRMGAKEIIDKFPSIVELVKKEGINVVWSCDPMHANVKKTNNNYKTRYLEDILTEIREFFSIHSSLGTYAGGIHLEMTGKDVTECVGGSKYPVKEENLSDRYHTHCDPRLNADQALEVAFTISDIFKKYKE
jgi:3-deoxy-7-phosphoheptulonate synthase